MMVGDNTAEELTADVPAADPRLERSSRTLHLGDWDLTIYEFTELQDDPGAVIWDAALVLVYYLLHQQQLGQSLIQDKVVLELGSGTGCVGLAAAALGARQVELTDLPHLVDYIRENIQVNHLGTGAEAHTLRWGNSQDITHIHSVLPGQRPPDIIIGSDIIYKRDASELESLFSMVAQMSGPATLTLLSVEDRPGVPVWQGHAEKHGLSIEEVPEYELHPGWTTGDIHVYKLRKTSQQLDPHASSPATSPD